MGKTRLDQRLVCLSLFESRARAAAAIKAGQVTVNGITAEKASMSVSSDDNIEAQAAHDFVSRGALKLQKGLAYFDYDVRDGVFVDIGASTGGFTDVLLRHGAALVYAVDVGQDQLHDSLLRDRRVENMAAVNARHLAAGNFDRKLDGLVCDVSFISQSKALDGLAPSLPAHAWAIALIKPQFELDKAALGKNGVVTDADLRLVACDDVSRWWQRQGWQVDDIIESPIAGPQGNVEYLIGARKSA